MSINVELRHLRSFVVVAEEENVRRAARRLHLVQPAVSRQIQQLEEDVGCPLFDRLPRGVRLNAAGQAFLEDARRLLRSAEDAGARALRISNGEIGRLRLGFVDSAAWAGSFPRSVSAFRKRSPGVSLELRPRSSAAQIADVEAREIDAGFAYVFEPLAEAVDSLRVREDRVVLAVPRAYGWRRRRRVRLSDLRSEPLVLFPRHVAPVYFDLLLSTVRAGGLDPMVVQEAPDEPSMLSLVSAGVGVSFVNSANSARRPEQVDLVEVEDLRLPLALRVVWRRDNSSAALAAFLEIVSSKADSPS